MYQERPTKKFGRPASSEIPRLLFRWTHADRGMAAVHSLLLLANRLVPLTQLRRVPVYTGQNAVDPHPTSYTDKRSHLLSRIAHCSLLIAVSNSAARNRCSSEGGDSFSRAELR